MNETETRTFLWFFKFLLADFGGSDDAGGPVGGGDLLFLLNVVLGLDDNIGLGLEVDEGHWGSGESSEFSSLVGVAVEVDNTGVGGIIDSHGVEDLDNQN